MIRLCATLLVAAVFSATARAEDVPRFAVDASWPKPLPNDWIMTGPSWQDGRIWHKRQQEKRRTIRVVGFAILLRMTSQKMGSIIEVDRLSKRFGKTDVLRSLSFSVSAKEVVSVIGPSGSGKTTLLRCLAMLESPTEGEIRLRGVPVAKATHTVELRRNARAVRADIGMTAGLSFPGQCGSGAAARGCPPSAMRNNRSALISSSNFMFAHPDGLRLRSTEIRPGGHFEGGRR